MCKIKACVGQTNIYYVYVYVFPIALFLWRTQDNTTWYRDSWRVPPHFHLGYTRNNT